MKKYAVLYSSKTGNTKQLADVLTGLLGNQCRQEAITPNMPVPEEEILLIGYWVDKGTCPEEVDQLLQALEGKQILFFATAGFGQTADYFKRIASGVEQKVSQSNRILGSFFCQGRMPDGIKMRYEKMLEENPEDQKAKIFLDNFIVARNHPDANDLKELLDFAMVHLPMNQEEGNSNV